MKQSARVVVIGGGVVGASVLYQWLVFQRVTGAGWRDLLPTAQDRQHLLTLWRRLSGR